jgi:hypothetical protein
LYKAAAARVISARVDIQALRLVGPAKQVVSVKDLVPAMPTKLNMLWP